MTSGPFRSPPNQQPPSRAAAAASPVSRSRPPCEKRMVFLLPSSRRYPPSLLGCPYTRGAPQPAGPVVPRARRTRLSLAPALGVPHSPCAPSPRRLSRGAHSPRPHPSVRNGRGDVAAATSISGNGRVPTWPAPVLPPNIHTPRDRRATVAPPSPEYAPRQQEAVTTAAATDVTSASTAASSPRMKYESKTSFNRYPILRNLFRQRMRPRLDRTDRKSVV